MITQPPSLEDNTLEFWAVSKCWHGRGGSLSTEVGMKMLNDIMDTSGPHRRVHTRAAMLQDNIIIGKPKTAQEL